MSNHGRAASEQESAPRDDTPAVQAEGEVGAAPSGPPQAPAEAAASAAAGSEPVAEMQAASQAQDAPPAEGESPGVAGADTPAANAQQQEGPGDGGAEAREEQAGSGTPVQEAAPLPEIARASGLMAVLKTVTQPAWWTKPRLAGLLAVLLVCLACTIALFVRYLLHPAALPDLLPLPVNLASPPHYLFSIHGVDQPVGVAYSPHDDRIYVAEGGGQRMIKAFDRDGNPLNAFAPPRTTASQRAPVYLATDSSGRLFVTDRLQNAIFVYDPDGNYLDTILDPDLSLSEYVAGHTAGVMAGRSFAYNRFEGKVFYSEGASGEKTLPAPDPAGWSPLGLRIDAQDRALLTDVAGNRHCVRAISSDVIRSPTWYYFEPLYRVYGEAGQNAGQLLFPNSAVADSLGRIHVVDGNNSRISVWQRDGDFLFFYGQGSAEGALNLPRGAAIDQHDRLHVVDAVGQCVRVYDVSEPEPRFLFDFGAWGLGDGEFNYPNDVALDETGRVYVADREGHRIQVWSY